MFKLIHFGGRAVTSTLIFVLVFFLAFVWSMISSKSILLDCIARSDCRLLYESELGIDTDNSRCSTDLFSLWSRVYVLFFDEIYMVDFSSSKESHSRILDSAKVIGSSGRVQMFMVSKQMMQEVGIPRLQFLLKDVALAVK